MVVVVPEITSGGLWRKEQVTTAIGSDPLTDRWDGGGISPSRPGGPTHTHTHLTHITHTQHTHTGKRVRSKVMQHASSRPIQVERIMLTIKIISIYSIRKGKN